MKKLELIFATLGGIAATYFKAYVPLFVIVIIAMMFDWVTGVMAAVIKKEGLSSDTARKGAIKKGVLLLSLMFGIFLDFMIPYAFQKMGLELGITLLFSNVIGFYIAFTECVSICENIYCCYPDAFPHWIVKVLANGKKQLESLGGDNFDASCK